MPDQVSGGLLSPLLRRFRIKAVRPFLTGRVLDFGCGVGTLAPFCDPAGYLGVDRDEVSLCVARETRAAHRFAVALPERGSFDTIAALAVIEHMPDAAGLLIRFATLLTPQGRIVLTTPEPLFAWLHAAGAAIGLFSHCAAEEHEKLFGRKALELLCRGAGLRVISYSRFMFGVNQLCILEKTATAGSSAEDLTMQKAAQPKGNYYDKYRAGNPLVKWMMDGFFRSFDRLTVASGALEAHEIGCGEGHLTLRLARTGLAVRSCDIAESCVEETRAAAEAAGFNINAQQCSLYDLRAPEDCSTLVVCCEVLEHLPDPYRAIDLLANLASPYLLASVPREPLWRVLNLCRGAYIAAAGNTPGHIQHWTSAGFTALLRSRFDIVELHHPLPWTVALCRKR